MEQRRTIKLLTIINCLQMCLAAAAVYPEDKVIRLIMNPTTITASAEATSSILLTCSCSSAVLSATSVVWRRNGTVLAIAQSDSLSSSSRYSSSFDASSGTAGFAIRTPQPRDSGYYDCSALVNGSRVISSQATVTIANKILAQDYGVVRGLDVEVHCPVEKTIPSYYPVVWYRNGGEILSGSRHRHVNGRTITIVKADYKDSGMYQCVSVTEDGLLRDAQTRVTVQGPPNAPLHLSGVSKTRDEGCRLLQWLKPGFDGNSPIKTYNLTCTDHNSGKRVITGCGSQTTRISVNGLERGVHYDCNVRAINDFGCSDYSNLFPVLCPIGKTTDHPNASTQMTARKRFSWIPTFVALSSVFSSGSDINVNVTGKPLQEVVTVLTSKETSSTQLAIALVLSAVGVVAFVALALVFWIHYCHRRTGEYKTQESDGVSNCHHVYQTMSTSCVEKQVRTVHETITMLKETDV